MTTSTSAGRRRASAPNPSGGIFDTTAVERELAAIDEKLSDASIWNDPNKAADLNRTRAELVAKRDRGKGLSGLLSDAGTLIDLDREGESVDDDFAATLDALEKSIADFEVAMMLSGEEDHHDAILDIHSGAGGVDAQDWADMLLRMYYRWAERNGFKVELIDRLDGEGAGIKSATLRVLGTDAYGWLKAERGVHRLVRISPFDANARRQTSFAAIDVIPEVDDTIEIKIEDKDLRVDTYRSSGAGGQHVNVTDSAVRLTHLPTNIVVTCQDERSQPRNREKAMRVLRARLYEMELRKREEDLAKKQGEKRGIDFGSQIRSYVLAPYRLVKDHRTSFEMGDVDRVLDGDLTGFMKAWLLSRAE